VRKVTLGNDVSVAAGPVGHNDPAGAGSAVAAEMLTYSHTKGLFAGIDFSGGVLRPDNDANSRFYGHAVSERALLLGTGHVAAPDAATPLISALNGKPSHRS
jgi:SH3 domain-containing YSC84-like protein 1